MVGVEWNTRKDRNVFVRRLLDFVPKFTATWEVNGQVFWKNHTWMGILDFHDKIGFQNFLY